VSPPTAGEHQRLEPGLLLQHLERERAGARDDLRVVGRVDEREAALRDQAVGDRDRLVVVATLFDEDGAQAAQRLVLLGVVAEGDTHRDRHAQACPRPGQAQPVIATRRRHHAASQGLRRHRGEHGQRVADLECARRLMVLVLDPDADAVAHRGVERGVRAKRRGHEVPAQPLACGADVLDRGRPRLHARTMLAHDAAGR